MPQVGGWQPSNQLNKQKLWFISKKLLASSIFPQKVLLKIGDHFVTPGNIQMGEGYKKN